VIAGLYAYRDLKRELIRGYGKECRRQLVFRGRRLTPAGFSASGRILATLGARSPN
jgi:hypothetical protein